ncbi:pyrroline-5-carboxylate reductase [Arthrobacter agilis]|jgi:pyrroline-5-carboxylate reductase|uniref:pyrroline-5-carboxylate reductase n=1 Tax=Arthrobacter agilis TaxID=37921 RepID=UPI00277FB3EE|nr:pyrroline-5-carboxylate reductase [Arthrobacter agilis]MDQ0736025.1 pyrroline-5-carboxylate reductase [Arthrobacter agilis]
MTPPAQRIAFLGCGSMNESILAGLLAAGLDPALVTATVRRSARAAELAERHGVTALATADDDAANVTAVRDADVVVLGVKPVGVVPLAREIATALKPSAVVLSVAAAVSIAMIEAALPEGQPVIRSMPNTPSRLGRGVLSISAGSSAGPALMAQARDLLRPAGTVVEIPEEQVDALSAVSGSGPAYAFYLAEAMAAAGVELGLDAGLSELIARETVAGAGFMLAEEGADAAALRRAVTSPNGTTQAAIETFEARDLAGVVTDGARAATARAAEITRGLAAPPSS